VILKDVFRIIELTPSQQKQNDPTRRRRWWATWPTKSASARKKAKLTIDELNALIVRELKKEGSIRFAGLGIFRKRKLKARIVRNPATGEQIKIPARTRLRFTPAKALKESVLGVSAPAAKKKPASKPKTTAARKK
jgi:DNA-binding protein HU-beta